MQLNIQFLHLHPDEDLKEAIRTKLSHLERYYDRIISCHVVISRENNSNQKNSFIEAKMEVPKKTIFASNKALRFEDALEEVSRALEQQLKHHKAQLDRVR